MRMWLEPAREIPIKDEVDVLVIGGGPAGFSAAVCAARQGARTLLVEQAGQVGGIATTGLMSHWTGDTRGGFYQEMLERSKGIRLDVHAEYAHEHKIINPEQLKLVLLEMLDEAGVDLLLYTFACGVIMRENTVTGVVLESKSGREAVLAKVVIDASGDGDIAAKAGAAYSMGRASDGRMQPMTVMFKVAGVDTDTVRYNGSFESSYPIPDGDLQTEGRRHIPHPAGHVLLYETDLPGVVTCNMTNAIGVDGTRAEDLTRAEKVCRSQIPHIVRFLRNKVPGFGQCHVISSASLMGVRETRHFIGEKTLTEEDILAARLFEDWAVCNAHFNFDVHNLSGAGLDETGVQHNFRQSRFYSIPYGCFIPQTIDGLMLAGRNISGTHMAHSSFRVMPICANMGQSVGIAAALCAAEGLQPRALPVGRLQSVLRGQGVAPL